MPNAHFQRRSLIEAALENEPHSVRLDVLAALDELAKAPTDPLGVVVHRARGAANRVGAEFIAVLPHGFYLTYRYHESVAPLMIPIIQVQRFLRESLPIE